MRNEVYVGGFAGLGKEKAKARRCRARDGELRVGSTNAGTLSR